MMAGRGKMGPHERRRASLEGLGFLLSGVERTINLELPIHECSQFSPEKNHVPITRIQRLSYSCIDPASSGGSEPISSRTP